MLTDVLDDLLAVAAGALEDPPERVFIGTGPGLAWDCEQLTARVGETTGKFQQGTTCLVGLDIDVHLTLIRCVPVVDDNGNPPSSGQLDEAGHSFVEEMEVLFEAVRGWSPPEPGQQAVIVSWIPLGPEGGYAGGEWTVRVRTI